MITFCQSFHKADPDVYYPFFKRFSSRYSDYYLVNIRLFDYLFTVSYGKVNV